METTEAATTRFSLAAWAAAHGHDLDRLNKYDQRTLSSAIQDHRRSTDLAAKHKEAADAAWAVVERMVGVMKGGT